MVAAPCSLALPAADPWAHCRRLVGGAFVKLKGEEELSIKAELTTAADLLLTRGSTAETEEQQPMQATETTRAETPTALPGLHGDSCEWKHILPRLLLGFAVPELGHSRRAECAGRLPAQGLATAPPGDVVEVIGTVSTGKTQLGLTVCAQAALCGHSVTYVTVKDSVEQLAMRLVQIASADPATPADAVAASLARVQLLAVADVNAFAQLVETLRQRVERAGCQAAPSILIVDDVATLMLPYFCSSAAAGTWRAGWIWRFLRQSAGLQLRILTLASPTGSDGPREAMSSWSPTRFLLESRMAAGRCYRMLTLLQCCWGVHAVQVNLKLDVAGMQLCGPQDVAGFQAAAVACT
eukprot:TRINITY_DN34785_c0_g1_i1.p1 TRINITY_DN34785_c0_g1~~TRINITY_DN34785_c0_g1_i1.p1  ORF type:complete len:353 (-),score=61.83 TRINITY_DN34785_c0_g1_i1:139-1197(-)